MQLQKTFWFIWGRIESRRADKTRGIRHGRKSLCGSPIVIVLAMGIIYHLPMRGGGESQFSKACPANSVPDMRGVI